ncbi:helix-turn-helix domain-containing protein [Vibrio quintilis]|uniref:MarR family protein n=1 Tax=Vibrio quintilis TaxID=1117707 RepID=A0A1M7YYP0_9VIBR|nr:helix-turn-helix domain-containing protein [Vibrio quintilis]SHO57751.1 hypothetical protein VQ7734_03521 [Vibrio quintilis]
MSVKVMSYVWDIPVFRGSDKLVMLCLADHADDSGFCWPSIETIARKSGVSATTVKTTLKKLEMAGWITRKNQFRKADSGKLVRASNQYQLPVMRLRKMVNDQLDNEQTHFDCSNPDQTKQMTGVSQIPAGGKAESGDKPSNDPLNDPSNDQITPRRQPLDFSVFGEISEQQVRDILRIRKVNAGKAPVTQKVLSMLAKEFALAGQQSGLSLQDCLDEWEYRGWRSFKAIWLRNSVAQPLAGKESVRKEQPDFHSGDTSWAEGLVLGV